ncbi:MAG: 50S ribosomal protein L24 [Candidatus Brocadiia bacterium]|jgi:large subunit ribosomal protein L24|nr:50S ribosomal protein L24 [Candidatus Brocadiia bacterium]
MRKKLHVRRNDTVAVTAGASKGKRGRILEAMPEKGKVIVEGANMVWKHLRRTQETQKAGRIEMEAPIDASNVMLLCQNRDCERYDGPVRTRKAVDNDGNKQRVCVKCSRPIETQE